MSVMRFKKSLDGGLRSIQVFFWIFGIFLTLQSPLSRNDILNTNNNEFNSAAIFPVWHELTRLRRGQINVAGIRRLRET